MTPNQTPEPIAIEGLRDVMCVELARIAIRTRENGTTTSAWRLSVSSAQGAGVIDLVETERGALYRGAGVFLGWPQAQLELAYSRLRPAGTEPEPDPGQFG